MKEATFNYEEKSATKNPNQIGGSAQTTQNLFKRKSPYQMIEKQDEEELIEVRHQDESVRNH